MLRQSGPRNSDLPIAAELQDALSAGCIHSRLLISYLSNTSVIGTCSSLAENDEIVRLFNTRQVNGLLELNWRCWMCVRTCLLWEGWLKNSKKILPLQPYLNCVGPNSKSSHRLPFSRDKRRACRLHLANWVNTVLTPWMHDSIPNLVFLKQGRPTMCLSHLCFWNQNLVNIPLWI